MTIVRAFCVLAVSCTAPVSAQLPPQPPPLKLAIVDRAGGTTSLGAMPGITFAPRVSPDGRRIAFDTFDGSIWVADLANPAAARRVISGRFPLWSPDGTRLLFAGPDGTRLFSQAADGRGTPELITDLARAPESWSSAAGLVSYITLSGQSDYDVWTYSPRDGSLRPLAAGPSAAQMGSRFSPDGRWLLYESNESGTFEIYVRPVADGLTAQVTQGGGRRAVWSADSREIFFEREGRLFAVPVRTDPRLEVGSETELPIKSFVQGAGRRQWDLTSDGRFLMLFQ
jgi:Tol biopolymer transport system component